MKKIIVMILSLFLLCGCKNTQSKTIQIDGIQPIKYEELIESLNSDVKFILYIGRDDCKDCQEFYPILEDYISSHEYTGIYYLNIKEYRDASRKEDATLEEKEFFKNIYKELHFDWTPTIHVVDQGRFVDTYQYLDETFFDLDKNQQEEKKYSWSIYDK